MKENMDFIGNGKSQGELGAYFGSQMDVGNLKPYIGKDGNAYVTTFKGGDAKSPSSYKTTKLNTNATLRRDEWKQLDEAILKISESRLGGVQDLISNGLVYNLGNGMGSTVLETHTMSDAMEADLTMDGISRSKNDRVNYETEYLPIPIIHVDYEINLRALAASRKLGNALDITSAERATRKVNQKLETMLFTDTTYAFGGGTIYSYLNHPDRNQETLSTNWDASAMTAALIIDDVLAMKQASISAKHFGPWKLYIPTAYETVLDEDYDTTKGITIRERILKIGGIKGVEIIDTLTADNVLLVQMTSDVVRLVRGMGIQNVQWKSEGNFIENFKVMTIQVPQVRSDQDRNSGIIHLA